MPQKQQGFLPIMVLFVFLALASVGTIAYQLTTKSNKPSEAVPSASPSASSSTTPSPTPSPSPSAKIVAKPAVLTVSPTPKPTSSVSIIPVSPIHAEPASISVSAKRSELDNIATFKLFYPGQHFIFIQARDGTAGIWGGIQGHSDASGDITDSATIQVHMADAYGRGIKSGVNQDTLLIKTGEDVISALNSGDVLSIPVSINVTD